MYLLAFNFTIHKTVFVEIEKQYHFDCPNSYLIAIFITSAKISSLRTSAELIMITPSGYYV